MVKFFFIILAMTSSIGLACDFSRERSCDEVSYEIGKVAKEMEVTRTKKARQTQFFKFRQMFDSESSLRKVDRYVTRVSPLMSRKLLEANYLVAVCEYELSEDKTVSLAQEAGKFCRTDNSAECFREFYAKLK